MAISLISLYSVKMSLLYAPFLMTLLGISLVCIDMWIYDFDYLIYIGNLLMIIAACWNSKLNSHKF